MTKYRLSGGGQAVVIQYQMSNTGRAVAEQRPSRSNARCKVSLDRVKSSTIWLVALDKCDEQQSPPPPTPPPPAAKPPQRPPQLDHHWFSSLCKLRQCLVTHGLLFFQFQFAHDNEYVPKKIRGPKFVVIVVECSIEEGKYILAPYVL